jgi:hypothetical protein
VPKKNPEPFDSGFCELIDDQLPQLCQTFFQGLDFPVNGGLLFEKLNRLADGHVQYI